MFSLGNFKIKKKKSKDDFKHWNAYLPLWFVVSQYSETGEEVRLVLGRMIEPANTLRSHKTTHGYAKQIKY